MFAKKKNNKVAGLTYIAQGTKITGESCFSGDALVGGELHGEIHSNGTITIEIEGLVAGDIKCKEIQVSGLLKGKLHCEKLIISGSGMVEGEVSSDHMEIFEGGQFIGVRVKETVERIQNTNPPLVDDKKLRKIMELDEKEQTKKKA